MDGWHGTNFDVVAYIPWDTSITALASAALIYCVGSSRRAHSLITHFQRSTRSLLSDASRRTRRDIEEAVVSSSRLLGPPSSVVMVVNLCCRSPRLRVRGSKPIKPSNIWDGMWRGSALGWCMLVGSLSDDPMKTQPMYTRYMI